MTLKLIDKDLKSKYAECLYKNQATFDKELNVRYKRLSVDFIRCTQNVDNGSQVFLNRIRQKRDKWSQDDINFRDHYRLVCRNVMNKKLENLRNALEKKKNRSSFLNSDPVIESKLKMLQDEADETDTLPFNYTSEINFNYNTQPKIITRPVLVPKLPSLQNLKNIDKNLYCKYSKSDRDFLKKYPGKVELQITKLGKQFISTEENRLKTLRKQIIRNQNLQSNATNDPRFNDLVKHLQ